MLPLIHAIATEVVDRRQLCRTLLSKREQLERSVTPEGLTVALSDLDAEISDHEDGIAQACDELAGYNLSVLRLNPLVVHLPGRTRTGDIVFCWREGEAAISHGHLCGEEDQPGCPLEVRVED